MRALISTWVAIFLVSGCDSLSKPKYDNPVVGPPPPRTSLVNEPPPGLGGVQTADAEAGVTSSGDITATALAPSDVSPDDPLLDSHTVAVVNKSPILAGEILERYGPQLAKAKKDLPPELFLRARRELIRQDLDSHIERKLLADRMRSTLKKEQIDLLNQFVDEAFNKEINRMMKQAGVSSTVELEQELRKQHTSLANLRVNFENQRMAMEFLGAKAKPVKEFGRNDLLRYYEEHKSDYEITPESEWQQIAISKAEHGSAEAKERLQQAIEFMRPSRGANFNEAAKKFSDGPKAENGGRWGWTKEDSLADAEVNRALFELPVGQPSQVLESAGSYKIVMVTDRKPGGYKPFTELQDEIRQNLEREARRNASKQVIADLKDSAEIRTIFDGEKKTSSVDDLKLPF